MKIRIIEFEGTEQEYQAVAEMLAGSATATLPLDGARAGADPLSVLRRALSRIPLPDTARDVMEAVIATGPTGVLLTELIGVLGVQGPNPERVVTGHIGALGHRFNATPGGGGQGVRMIFVLDKRDGVPHYTIRPEMAAPLTAILNGMLRRKPKP